MSLQINIIPKITCYLQPTSRFISVIIIIGIFSLNFGSMFVTSLECEYFNATECGLKNGGPCEKSRRNISCGEDDPSKTHGCYVLWRKNNDSDEEVLQLKGCFLNNKQCSKERACIERNHPKSIGKGDDRPPSKTLFCCCNQDYCNQEYVWDPLPTTSTAKPIAIVSLPRQGNQSSIVIFILVPAACTLIFMTAWLLHRRVIKKPLPDSTSRLSDEENILLDKSESIHTPSVTLVEVKAAGRFGHVWKASMAGQNSYVAVKILPIRERASWKLEQEIYSLPLMDCSDWILKFYGARTVSEGENFHLWLISEYLEKGSLYDYLKGNILTWNELLKIAVTMCQGLAFLHEEIDSSRGHKPSVAHRDFKSKNVLLKPDLTACIADFGLAHIFYPNVPVGTCHGQIGTRRYMSPEVLEGAVSFTRDNFQRIDMYACGLVLWELATRCTAQKGPVAEYRLPFEEFIGQMPTLEEMQDVVVMHRKRPSIRSDWNSHVGLQVLVEAMRDAWDQDAEARISASCIVERLNGISNKFSSSNSVYNATM